ncbi:MAG: DUF2029 domain-containing protein [Chloroflexi bacterium]|nr:DUF2029 domain-containing protein [Chloroflexota bacterium]
MKSIANHKSKSLREIVPPKRLLNWSLWVIILLVLFPFYLRMALVDPVDYSRGGLGGADFKAYYIAARLLVGKEDIYSTALHEREMQALGLPIDGTLYVYPSLLAVVLMPLSRLSIEDAARVWNSLNLVFLVSSLVLVTRALDLRRLLGLYYPWLIILFALAAPTIISLRVGQMNIGVLFLLAAAFVAGQQRRSAIAGSALSLAILLKVFPLGLLAWYFWKRQYWVVGWAVGTSVIVLSANGLFLGLTGREWIMDVRYATQVFRSITIFTNVDNQSLYGFLSRFELPAAWLNGLTLSIGSILGLVTGLCIARVRHLNEFAVEWAAVLLTLLLVTTITWWSTLVLLFLPFVILLREVILAFSFRFVIGMVFSYILINAVRVLYILHVEALYSPWLVAMPFYGVLLLWMVSLWRIARLRQTSGCREVCT